MIGLDCQLDDLPIVFVRYLMDALLQTVMHRPYHHLSAPLGTPDDVVHEVEAVLLMLLVQVGIILVFNTERQPEGPFTPWFKPRGFLAHCL